MNMYLKSEEFHVGRDVEIGEDVIFHNFKGGPMKYLKIGDCTRIYEKTRVSTLYLSIGDYCTIHNHSFIFGEGRCEIGHNCWFGEYTKLNTHGDLIIGNNVQIGMGTEIWTHVRAGELLEGSLLCDERPVIIEDDVWLVGGGIIISPNITLARGTVILTGSVVTKSTRERGTYAGVPAIDISDKVKAWRDITIHEKFSMMQNFSKEFIESIGGVVTPRGYICNLGEIHFSIDLSDIDKTYEQDTLIISLEDVPKKSSNNVSYFSLSTKKYTKKFTPLEKAFMRFIVGYRARFIPA